MCKKYSFPKISITIKGGAVWGSRMPGPLTF